MRAFQNLYEVRKTVRFELKPIDEKGKVYFPRSKEFMEKELFQYSERLDSKEERNEEARRKLSELFVFSEKIYAEFLKFLEQLERKEIPFSGVETTAQLMEHLDSQEFHRNKRGINRTKFVPLHHLAGDFFLGWFFDGMRQRIQEIKKFEVLIKNHQLWIQSDFMAMESAVRWYADIESFAKRIEDLLLVLSYMRLPDIQIQEKENWTQEEQNIWNNAIIKLEGIFDTENQEQQKENTKQLQELIKENAFVECGMLSMNEKGLNKNPQKIEKMKDWLDKILAEQEGLLRKIRSLDEERKLLLDGKNGKDGLYKLLDKESEQWVKNGVDKCDEFAFYLLKNQKYNQELHEKKQKFKKLRETPHDKRSQEFYDLRDDVDRLKIEKGVIQDRKRLFLEKGILSFKCFKNIEKVLEDLKEKKNPSKKAQLLNFQYIWEGKFKNPKNSSEIQFLQIEGDYYNKADLAITLELKQAYSKNIELIKQKREFSQKYGNNKSLINSLQREIERQGKIEYQGVLLKDDYFFYLAFLKRETRKDLWKQYFSESQDSDFKALKYEKLTFKALEKLALIENATFTEFDELENAELAKKLRETYEKTYKEKQFLEYKLTKSEKQYCSFDKIKMQNFAKEQQNELKNDVIQILIKVIAKLGYSFVPKSFYATLDEFASDVNLQCYTQKWIRINKEKLFGAEKNGEIQIFKVHNKDFSKAKRTYKNRKNDLFTEYWLDLLERGNTNIRILPEIDLFKKRKEKEIGEVGKIITKRKDIKLDKEGNRFCEDKLYAAFRLEFYPEKNSPTVEEFNEKLRTKESKYFLGLDRGENELLTYCLIDEQGKVMSDKKTGKKLLGDWNFDENGFDYAKDLKKFTEKRVSLLENATLLKNGEESDEGKEKIRERLKEIITSEKIKRGICGHILEQINEIMMQYPNTFIVLEDLDISQNYEEQGNTNKEKMFEKTLGGTAYQVVEDAIISKFKYYQTKNNQFEGVQFAPNVERVRDLREVKDKSELERNKSGRIKFIKSKDQIGRVLFVDEFLSSQMCPECGFCITTKEEKERAKRVGKPILQEDIRSLSWDGSSFTVGEKYKIKQIRYIQDEKNQERKTKDILGNIQGSASVNSNILGLLVPRLKSRKDLYKWKEIKSDPFFCPRCGKNTEEKNFIEPFDSGDDIAAYNIARRGLFVIKNP